MAGYNIPPQDEIEERARKKEGIAQVKGSIKRYDKYDKQLK